MSSRLLRPIVLGAGIGALVLASAAPATAQDISITSLPANQAMTGADVIKVAVPTPDGFHCGVQGVTWVARVPGRQDAVLLSTNSPCTMTGLAVDVTVNPASRKKNAVVKLVGANAAGGTSVMTLVVHVTGKPRPGHGGKPS
jgi:hypothetical protein